MPSLNKLLIVKTTSLGDVVHNLPIIADIRAHFPNITIDWLVEESFADIPRMHFAFQSNVNNVITVAIRRWRKQLFHWQTWNEMSSLKKQLASAHYDAVLDTQGLIKSALISRLSGINARHGLDKNSAREPLASYFYTKTYAIPRNLHAVARNRLLAAAAFGYTNPSTAPNYGLSDIKPTLNEGVSLPTSYIVGLHGTSRDTKCWPNAYWIALGLHCQQSGYSLLLPWGNEKERLCAIEIARKVPLAVVLPKLTISQIACVIANAAAVVGVDTGLVHLAVALNLPTVAIYTDTDPKLTGVYPADPSRAVSLGGVNQCPSVTEVWQAIVAMNVKSSIRKR